MVPILVGYAVVRIWGNLNRRHLSSGEKKTLTVATFSFRLVWLRNAWSVGAFALQEFHAGHVAWFLPTFGKIHQYIIQGSSSPKHLKMGQIGCHETSVNCYEPTPRKPHLQCKGSLKSLCVGPAASKIQCSITHSLPVNTPLILWNHTGAFTSLRHTWSRMSL